MAKKRAGEPRTSEDARETSTDREIQSRLRDVTRSDAGTSPRPDGEPSDADLMAQLATGEVDALEVLYDRYSMLVFSLGLRILRDPQLAEDVVQEPRPDALKDQTGRAGEKEGGESDSAHGDPRGVPGPRDANPGDGRGV